MECEGALGQLSSILAEWEAVNRCRHKMYTGQASRLDYLYNKHFPCALDEMQGKYIVVVDDMMSRIKHILWSVTALYSAIYYNIRYDVNMLCISNRLRDVDAAMSLVAKEALLLAHNEVI